VYSTSNGCISTGYAEKSTDVHVPTLAHRTGPNSYASGHVMSYVHPAAVEAVKCVRQALTELQFTLVLFAEISCIL
jgi:hypothetical protein